MAKDSGDLVAQSKRNKTYAQQQKKAAGLIDPGFLTEPAAAAKRTRTQPADALQANMQQQFSAGTQGAEPTRFAKGGKVGKDPDAKQDAGMVRSGVHQHEANMHKGEKETNLKLKKGGKVNWIKDAVKKPGALHRELGVPQGEKIPKSKIDAAANSSNPKLRRRAKFAETVSKFADGGPATGHDRSPAETGVEKTMMPRSKIAKYAVGGIAKIRHNEATPAGKQKPSKGSGWDAYK